MAIADRSGLPVAICIESASPHEVTLVEPLLDEMLFTDEPERLIGDMAYGSDGLDERLKARGVEMIAPHRSNRVRPPTQDGPPMRRYRRRWKVERLFAWLQNYRRILVRHEISRKTTLALFCSDVSSSCSETFYEMRSSL
jgi:transposase